MFFFKRGVTPLHLACRGGQMETIIELLQLNADVEASDDVTITYEYSFI
jgi:ankyrin repeat protein